MAWGEGKHPFGQQRSIYGFVRGRHCRTYDLKDELEFLKLKKENIDIKKEDVENRLKEIRKLIDNEK